MPLPNPQMPLPKPQPPEEIEKVLKAISEDDPEGDDEELQNYKDALLWAAGWAEKTAEDFINQHIRS
jgi:hypothetical protein